jgi:hypothetical protein
MATIAEPRSLLTPFSLAVGRVRTAVTDAVISDGGTLRVRIRSGFGSGPGEWFSVRLGESPLIRLAWRDGCTDLVVLGSMARSSADVDVDSHAAFG